MGSRNRPMAKSDCRCETWKATQDSGYTRECYGPDGRQCAKAVVRHESRVEQQTYFIDVWAVGASGKRYIDNSGPWMVLKTTSSAKAEADKMLARVRADAGFSGLKRKLGRGKRR